MPTTSARSASTLAALSFVFVWPASAFAQLGSSYCPAVANSTGAPARIVATGTVDVALDQLELRCEGLPAGAVGLFLFGRDEAFLPGHAGNVGTLCLAAPFTRDPLGALQATQAGVVRRALDLASVPLPGGPTSVVPGDTLRVQYWYRDTTPLGGTANSSDGYRLTFAASFPDAAEVLVATGLRPRIELGDVDGDGALDIVAVGSEGRVTVHRNLGGRTFEERTRLELGELATDLALGDFDGDGDIDAAIALYGSGVITLLTNDGEGVLERRQDIVGLPLVRFIRSADLDGDGALDLVAVQYGSPVVPSEVVSLRNLGALQFGVIDRHVGATGYGYLALAVGDLDGDQDVDVLFIDHSPLSVPAPLTTVLLNDGLGAWTARAGPATPSYVNGVHLADVDGDGVLDALLRTVSGGFSSTGISELHLGDGAGGFVVPATVHPVGVIGPAEDFDRDGDLDFVGIGPGSTFAFLENRGGALQAVEHRALARVSSEARFADLDGDGWPELVLPKLEGEAVGVRRMGPSLDIAEDEHHYTFPQPREVGQGDLDGDGDPDFVAWGYTHTFVLENRGSELAVAVPSLSFGSDAQHVFVIDIDGDQQSDLVSVLRNPWQSISIGVRRGLGGFSFAPLVQHVGVRAVTRAGHGDLDGDGREDLVLASDFGLAVCLNDGAGGFRAPLRVGGNVLTRDVALVDLDRDGALDIVAAEAPTATVAAYFGDGAGGFGARVAVSVGANPSGLASGDWDQDGWSDVVVRNAGNGTLQALMNDGAGQLLAMPPFAASDVTNRIGVGDLDGDGLLDLALATGYDESVVILSGLGDGTFAQRRAYAVRRPAWNVLPVDVDGDGVQELVALVSLIGGFVTVLR